MGLEDGSGGISREPFDPSRRLRYAKEATHSDQLDADYYESALGIDLSDLKGKDVLDIGGAPNGLFANEAQSLGVKVFNLNAVLRSGYGGRPIFEPFNGKPASKHTKTVGGLVQQMPFEDNKFDYELSIGSIPAYLPEHESEYRQSFDEIIRTLKPGAKGIFFPVMEAVKDDLVFKEILRDIEKKCRVEFEHAAHFNQKIGERPMKLYRMTLVKL